MAENSVSYKVFLTSSDEKSEIRYIAIDPDAKEDFKCLQKKIESNFPILSKKTFDIYWMDAENDKIKISSNDELVFALAKMGALKKFYVMETVILDKKSLKEGKFVTSKRESGGLYIHSKIVCANCKGKVYGYRYKCIGCPNYDLCQTCEGNNVHPNHLMLRLPMPIEAVEFDCVVQHVGNWVNKYFNKPLLQVYQTRPFVQRPSQYYENVGQLTHSEGCKAGQKREDKDLINEIKQSFLSNGDDVFKTTIMNGTVYKLKSDIPVYGSSEMNDRGNVSLNQTKQKLDDVIEDIMVTLLYTEGSSADKEKRSVGKEGILDSRVINYLAALNERNASILLNAQPLTPKQQESPKPTYRKKSPVQNPIMASYDPWKLMTNPEQKGTGINESVVDPSTLKKPMPPHVAAAMVHFRNMGYKNKNGALEAMIERHNGNINEVLDIIAASDD